MFEHALVAAFVQTIIGLQTGKWWAGGALSSGYFVGRELAQAEYRWIEQVGTGLRADMRATACRGCAPTCRGTPPSIRACGSPPTKSRTASARSLSPLP